MTLAAERDAGAPSKVSARAPITSPPTCVIGRRALAPSRRKRMATQVSTPGWRPGGNSADHPRPAPDTAIPRSRQTTATPQPAASKARTTGSAPVEKTRATAAATPAIHAVLITQLIESGPPRQKSPLRPKPLRSQNSPLVFYPDGFLTPSPLLPGRKSWRTLVNSLSPTSRVTAISIIEARDGVLSARGLCRAHPLGASGDFRSGGGVGRQISAAGRSPSSPPTPKHWGARVGLTAVLHAGGSTTALKPKELRQKSDSLLGACLLA